MNASQAAGLFLPVGRGHVCSVFPACSIHSVALSASNTTSPSAMAPMSPMRELWQFDVFFSMQLG
jgi:hypothetical protein